MGEDNRKGTPADRTDLITEKHYNIEVEAERLQERYLQLYKERCQA